MAGKILRRGLPGADPGYVKKKGGQYPKGGWVAEFA